MDKINYNQHDWSKGEVIKEENLDNMENGIKQATDKINEIIDTEQDFRDRMTDIDGRIDINNEELVIARDGCDNLGQRIERDQQYIYNILNDGSYLEFNGTDITVDNSKEGYTSNMVIKGQTYQNLLPSSITLANDKNAFNHNYNNVNVEQGDGYIEVTSKLDNDFAVLGFDVQYLNNNLFEFTQTYLIIAEIEVLNNPSNIKFRVNGFNCTPISKQEITQGKGIIASTLKVQDNYNGNNGWVYFGPSDSCSKATQFRFHGAIATKIGEDEAKSIPIEDLISKYWCGKFEGIKSVGDKENNKISILSHNKNLIKEIEQYNNSSPVKGLVVNTEGNNICINGVNPSNSSDVNYMKRYASNGTENFVTIEKGKTYCLSMNYEGDYTDGNVNPAVKVTYDDGSVYWLGKGSFTAKQNGKATWIRINITANTKLNNFKASLQFEEGTKPTNHEPYKEDKKEILIGLDSGLKSLPNGTCDTIEQRDDGVYLVQRVGKVVLTGSEGWGHNEYTPNQNNTMCFNSANVVPIGNVLISDKFSFLNTSDFDNSDFECITSGIGEPYGLMIRINKNVLNQQNVNGFREWLQANPTTVYYKLATPIETKLDIDTINLEVFKDKTYILSENSIKPEITCKAPVDINQTIADLQEEQEQLMETYNTLKEENETAKMAISELNEQEDVQTADMLDLDMRVLALEEGLE